MKTLQIVGFALFVIGVVATLFLMFRDVLHVSTGWSIVASALGTVTIFASTQVDGGGK